MRRAHSWATALVTATALAGASASARADQVIAYRSLHDIEALFASYRYTPKDWRAGERSVPRIYLDDVPSNWRETYAKRIPIGEKKSLFFRFLGPVVLYVNEQILADRSYAEALLARQARGEQLAADDREWLSNLAAEYDVPGADSGPLDAALGAELLRRVDAIPPSLALAQGAVESGWGTSRFADVGNSLFGQWSWSGGI
ncbi:MAG TPA: glucosaminidase domain-containing protein, partial [Gammaproteobacteria bacterium]|nr:glucosaminidase domain-containing protein [Gammaproteobacteria bacterium]